MSSGPMPSTGASSSRPADYRPTDNLHQVGLLPFVALLFAYCAGGPFGVEAIISTAGPGLALILILVVPLLFAVPTALATAEMTTAMPVEGGFYRWTRTAMGDFWGFQCGWWNWTGTFLVSAAYAVEMADYFDHWIIGLSRAGHWAVVVMFVGIVAGLNIRGIRLVGNLTLVLLLVMLLPMTVFVFLGYSHIRFNPFHPFFPTGKPWHESFGVGLALALWMYAGYEQLSTVIEEVKDPRRNFPRGLAIVVPLAMATFFFTLSAGLAALGNWRDWDTGYLVTAGRLLGGPALGTAVFVAGVICSFVLLDSTLLSVTRLPLTMAEDGYFDSGLAKVSSRFGTPVRSILLSAVLCSGLAFLTVPQLIAIYAWTRMATSLQTLFSFWQLRRKYPNLPRSFRVPGGAWGTCFVVLAPTLLFAWALLNNDPATRKWGILNLVSGPLAYLWIYCRRRLGGASGVAPLAGTRE